MTGECQRQVFGQEAVAIVDDSQLLGTTAANLNADARGTCIERVLDQFLGNGNRSFDDLAGSDLVDHGNR